VVGQISECDVYSVAEASLSYGGVPHEHARPLAENEEPFDDPSANITGRPGYEIRHVEFSWERSSEFGDSPSSQTLRATLALVSSPSEVETIMKERRVSIALSAIVLG
jgi:hypothetical protein